MANKDQTQDTAKGQAEPEETKQAQELLDINELRTKHRVGKAIYAGVCAAQKWNPGKQISEEAFLQAVEHFKMSPMDGRNAKEKEDK